MHCPPLPLPCSFTKPATDSGMEYFYALYKPDTDQLVGEQYVQR